MSSKPQLQDGKPGTGTAQRVTTLLSFLADADGPVSVRHVADRLSLAPSTTHRLLHLLVESGFAMYEPKTATYGIGSEFYRVSARVTSTVNPAGIAHGAIAALAHRFDETVLFAMYLRQSGKITFMSRADGQKKLLYRVEMNTPLSLVWGASGKAALAYLPEEDVRAILSVEQASPATGDAPPDYETLAGELAAIREKGFCISYGEKLPGALGIAAPVFGPQRVIGTICMTMPRDRAPSLSHDDLGQAVLEAAKDLTRQLGGRQ